MEFRMEDRWIRNHSCVLEFRSRLLFDTQGSIDGYRTRYILVFIQGCTVITTEPVHILQSLLIEILFFYTCLLRYPVNIKKNP